MKKILVAAMLIFSLFAKAQTDSTEMQADSVQVKLTALPDSTAVGASDGTLVSKEIGPSGGKIISDDGRVELIFPAGALTAKKTISIQPIVNLIPNGNGKGYRFEPSGIHFAKPVDLVFHYTNESEETCPALLQFMAIQNDNGRWEYMDYEDWDSTAKTLKGQITHFSAMVDGNLVDLGPPDKTLRCGKKETLFLSIVKKPEKETKAEGNDDDLPALPTANVSSASKEAVWFVNNIRGGSGKVGTIRQDVSGFKGKVSAIYTAPNMLTNDKWMTIKLLLVIHIFAEKGKGRAGKKQGKMIDYVNKDVYAAFTATVHLFDEYKVSIKDYSEPRPEMGTFIFSSGSFTVRIDQENIDINDKQIDPPSVVKRHEAPKPFKVAVDISGSKGSVNLDRLVGKGRSYTEGENGSLTIALQFASDQVYAGKVSFSAKGMPSPEPTMFYMYSFPKDIKFSANGKPQIIEKSTIPEIPYRINVTPIRSDE